MQVLLRHGIGDQLYSKLGAWPVLALQAVEDGSGVAVLLSKALFEHLSEKFLLQVLELGWVDVRLVILCLLLGFLTLLLLSHLLLEFNFFSLEEFICLVCELRTALHAPVVELVEPYDSPLVLLGEIVRKSGLAALLWTDDHDVELVCFLHRGRVLHLKSVFILLSEDCFELAFLLSELVSARRDFLLGPWWWLIGGCLTILLVFFWWLVQGLLLLR